MVAGTTLDAAPQHAGSAVRSRVDHQLSDSRLARFHRDFAGARISGVLCWFRGCFDRRAGGPVSPIESARRCAEVANIGHRLGPMAFDHPVRRDRLSNAQVQ